MPNFSHFLAAARQQVEEVCAAALHSRDAGVVLIDVREASELGQGAIPGANWIPRGALEMRIGELAGGGEVPIVLYCATGTRSVLAARTLLEMGYQDVRSLEGGFTAWLQSGYETARVDCLSGEQEARYARHTLLPEIGTQGQLQLLESKVLCVGAGGLGSPAALYLAAAGVGTIGLVDDDIVEASNLQRQILHSTARLGMAKVDSGAQALEALNPDVTVVRHKVRLGRDNADDIVPRYDLVVDGSDNFETRYVLNDVALRHRVGVIHASIYRFEGQATVFSPAGGPCYRCLHPNPPPKALAPSCAEAGVLGVLPGIMGVLQATETIKILLGLGSTLTGRLLTYDATEASFREIRLRRNPMCSSCGEKA